MAYLDDNGNPLQQPAEASRTYLDDNGHPISVANTARGRLENLRKDDPNADTSVAKEFFTNTPLGNLMTGAAKGAAHTVVGLGALAHKLPGMDVIAPDRTGALSGDDPDVNRATTPNGGMQKLGYGAEQVGEFFVPGAAEAGALAPAAKLVGKAGLLGRAAVEGANAAAVTEAQGGNPVAAGVTAAAVPIVGAALSKVAPKAVNALIGAKPKAFRRGAEPGEAIVNSGTVATTLGNLAEKVKAQLDQVGQKIGTTLGVMPKANTVRIDVTQNIEPILQRAETALQTIGDTVGVARLAALRQGLYDRFAQIGSSATAATPREAFVVKKVLDDSINHAAAEGVDASTKQVVREIRRAIARDIATAVPELGPLNQKYASLSEAFDAISNKINASHAAPMASISKLANLPLQAATSTLPVTAAAQVARGAGNRTAQTIGARTAAAGVSRLTQPDLTDILRDRR